MHGRVGKLVQGDEVVWLSRLRHIQVSERERELMDHTDQRNLHPGCI
jgi:hypothetical protein